MKEALINGISNGIHVVLFNILLAARVEAHLEFFCCVLVLGDMYSFDSGTGEMKLNF